MEALFNQLAYCIESGKINNGAPHSLQMKDKDGVNEIAKTLLKKGVSTGDILAKALIIGTGKGGIKFRKNKIFVQQVLMSSKALSIAIVYLNPSFAERIPIGKEHSLSRL
jgi:methanogenic corrinoid protein MtbC1